MTRTPFRLPTRAPRSRPALAALPLCLLLIAAACQPSVRVEAPKEPITINLNVNLDAEVRVKLEEQAEEDIDKNPDIF
jgi:hypothetical protein